MKDNYATPEWLMSVFGDWFDPCPLNPNPDFDGLKIKWKDKTYVNPPYSNPLKWVEKAIKESKRGKTIVMLLRVDTSTKWFAKLVEAKAEILWFNGRLKFIDNKPANFPSMLVILKN
jgi:hypothetical protein